MGCDIHVVLEKKFGDKWVGLHECRSIQYYPRKEDGSYEERPTYIFCNASSRNYVLFSRLAGVRGEGPDPKGLPEDASELAQVLYSDDIDLHSHSWCSLEEYIQHLIASEYEPAKAMLTDSVQMRDPYRFYFHMYPPEDDEQYRVVFAFDN